MRRSAACLIAALVILLPGPLNAAGPPPVIVHIADTPDNQCVITADGEPIAINTPPPPPLKLQMRSRGVRLTYADPKPDFHCISGVIVPLQAEGIDIRT